MLAYLERVHEGVRGIVTDAETGLPLAAAIEVDGNGFPAYTDPDVGDYHRLLLPGTYTLEVSAPGYLTQSLQNVEVLGGDAVRHDVRLTPAPVDLHLESHRVEDGDDGWLDPGETADLPVTLRNLGRTATAVGATLVPTGWYGEVVREQATWPDIGINETRESDAPHHGIRLDPDVPAGHKVGFALQWQSAQASGLTQQFFLEVGSPVNTTADDNVSQPILDHTTTTAQLTLTDDLEIDAIRVALDVEHTWIGDLEIDLTSPSLTKVRLHNGSGGSTHDIVGTYGVDLTPAEPLDAFSGETVDGTWTLEIRDTAGGDTGTLNSWGIDIDGHPLEASTPEMRFKELSVEAGEVRLEWWPYPGVTSYGVYRSTDPSDGAMFLDVTPDDPDDTDTTFTETPAEALVFYLVTGYGPLGEGPKGHFGE
jgi:subtilisin-like proprotein convertase family protein